MTHVRGRRSAVREGHRARRGTVVGRDASEARVHIHDELRRVSIYANVKSGEGLSRGVARRSKQEGFDVPMGTKQQLKCSKYEERNAAELDRAEQQKKKTAVAN